MRRRAPAVPGCSAGPFVRRPAAGQTVGVRMMLLTSGTRGDVEPFAALARHAAAQGHRVRLGVP